MKFPYCLALLFLSAAAGVHGQTASLPVPGYGGTSVNGVVFRQNSVVSDGKSQYVAYYDGTGKVILAKRTLGSTTWQTVTTQYTGTISDAHRSISIMVDGDGYLHMVFDMHASAMRYCRSTAPGSLTMGSLIPMVGSNETTTTYPQFFRLANGNMLFTYRDGNSGDGNLVLNQYDTKTKAWKRIYTNLLDGQGARNPYQQMQIDGNGVIHISWVWRESSNVSSNHDMCYAMSKDGGVTWQKSTGEKYAIPINATTAEYVAKIPQSSNLINSTSMWGDEKSRPYIITYFSPTGSSVPQYQLFYNPGTGWKTMQVLDRKIGFSLSGSGTQKIPIARPQIMVDGGGDSIGVYMVFRDTERNNKVSLAQTTNLGKTPWTVTDLTSYTVDSWEPSFDTELWKASHILDIYVQRMAQGANESTTNLAPQTVTILEWKSPATTHLARPGVVRTRIHPDFGSTFFDMLGRRRLADPGLQNLSQGVYGIVDGERPSAALVEVPASR